MKTTSIIVLSVVLAAALVFGFIFYQRSRDAQAALKESEEKVAVLNSEISRVREQAAEISNRIKELEGAQTRISELEQAISQKDNAFSELSRAARSLKRELEEERKLSKKATSQLAAKDSRIAELQVQVQGLQTTIRSLEEEVSQSRRELNRLPGTRARMAELEKEIGAKEATLADYEERIRKAQSRSRSLEEQLAEKQRELSALEMKLSTLRGEKASAEANIDELKTTYESLVNDLKERVAKQEVTIEQFEKEISVTCVDRILFNFGRAAVTSEGKEVLDQVGQSLKGVKDRKIRVVGHTDTRPIHPDYRYKFPSNWELSSARASAVIQYFQQEIGLDPTHLEAVGRAFYDPIASNQTPEGRAHNRRVEIIIAPELE